VNFDTAGNIIYELIDTCDCNLTGGCPKCNPYYQINYQIKETYNEFDKTLRECSKNASSIEEVRKITDKLPSLTKLLKESK